ncbi:hypothetical protein EJB05_21499 [Eragrostis curvula]|uniref:RING-type domain-containing protein n=1 Tax=Eragrostis curvula TaxID=38414 RepID=A0A5J9V356_9POAL|nr:hypothetical protein EJB05_21499 [Eragrostis curvula]
MGDVVGAGGMIMDGQRALLPQAFAPAGDAQSRALCSGSATTSGRPACAAPVSQGVLSHLYRHSVDADALIRIENERLRLGLLEARRRHVRAAVSALETAAARRLRDAEAELERSLCRHAELEQKVQQMCAEAQAWQGVAKSHEAVTAGLRSTLDQLLRSPPPRAGAEDAQSCCYEQEDRARSSRGRACKSCGEAEACVLLLPCRHLCLCAGCEAAADACPVCAATKNAALHVLLS